MVQMHASVRSQPLLSKNLIRLWHFRFKIDAYRKADQFCWHENSPVSP